MGISGYIKAKCKLCGKESDWYSSSSLPFVDSEIVGTCDDCINNEECR